MIARCSRCRYRFDVPDDEPQGHDCPKCGFNMEEYVRQQSVGHEAERFVKSQAHISTNRPGTADGLD